MGFNMSSKVYGIVGGSGKIGKLVAKCLRMGFGARVLVYDSYRDPELVNMGVEFVDNVDSIYSYSDVICLHCPLIKGVTEHLINSDSISKMKDGVMIINTSRGGLCRTDDLIEGLKSQKIGSLGIGK